MSLKTIWWPIAGGEKTAVPVWDNDKADPESTHHWTSWRRVVAVDATRDDVPAGETTTIAFMGVPRPGSTVVGLNRFYVVPVNAATLQSINQAIQDGDARLRDNILASLGRDLKIADMILYIGMHVTSKEIDDWTWATFWWHDKPNDGPFAADRPSEVQKPWTNYLMTIADDQVTPKEADGSARVAYNPWLEGGFNNGIVSNCMSCHHRAGFSSPPVSFLPVTRGLPDPTSDPAFRPGRLQTDFMWSILFESK